MMITPLLENTTHFNISGAYSQSYSPFEVVNPFCPITNLLIIDGVCNIHKENEEMLLSCASDITVSESSGNMVVEFPSHCDVIREFYFKVKA